MFLLSFQVIASECFTVGKDKFKLEKVMEKENDKGKYLLVKSGSKFSNYYFCAEKKGKLFCSGDDDKGEFVIDKVKMKITLESALNFGAPDGPSYVLNQKNKSYSLKKCP
jgi:hypothetical protein